jgi:hypothetical protein
MRVVTGEHSATASAMDNSWDDLIFSQVSDRWLKVARIIASVSDRMPNGPHFEEIATRIRTLVDEGKLDAKGDLSRWPYSEIRLAQSSQVAPFKV